VPLDPQTVRWLDELSGAPPLDLRALTAAQFRAGFTVPAPDTPATTMDLVVDRIVDLQGVPRTLRLYYPVADRHLPMTLFLHGGGFVIGGPDITDEMCRTLAATSGSLVVSVDYRLAPETPFPGGLRDSAAALRYIHEHAGELGGRADTIAVAGDSSGGNFAAVLAQMSRDGSVPPLCHQLLLYPVLDERCDAPSFREHGTGYLLTAELMRWYWRQYLPAGHPGGDWRIRPISRDDLGGLPAATIVTAEYDVVRDEAERYAGALAAAGVDVHLSRWDGQIHGFLLRQGAIDAAGAALTEAGERLRAAFTLVRTLS